MLWGGATCYEKLVKNVKVKIRARGRIHPHL